MILVPFIYPLVLDENFQLSVTFESVISLQYNELWLNHTIEIEDSKEAFERDWKVGQGFTKLFMRVWFSCFCGLRLNPIRFSLKFKIDFIIRSKAMVELLLLLALKSEKCTHQAHQLREACCFTLNITAYEKVIEYARKF